MSSFEKVYIFILIHIFQSPPPNPTRPHTDSFTPLIVAAAGGHLAVVKKLLDAQAAINAEHPEGVNGAFGALSLPPATAPPPN